MAIKFSCACGQRLKARDDSAARRVVCPRCHASVGVPSLQPTHSGTPAAPLSPEERRRRARGEEEAITSVPDPAPPPSPELEAAISDILTGTARPRRRTAKDLEKRATEFLRYPLGAWWLCLWLGLLMAVLTVVAMAALPELVAAMPDEAATRPTHYGLYLLAFPLVVLFVGVPSAFLDCVLTAAVAGKSGTVILPADFLRAALTAGLKWLACFLAGPVVFAVVACLYWLHCGEPTWLDDVILIELAMVGLSWWLLALLTLSDQKRLRDLNPLAVVDLAHRLGWRGQVLLLAAAVTLLVHAWFLAGGLATLHRNFLLGLLLVSTVWVTGLLASTFFCRVLGVRCHLSRPLPSPGRP